MKILNYGSLNIDLVFSVPHIVVEGETISSTALVKSAGGKGANQSAAIAKAGLEVYHAGKVGQDGIFLIDLLKSYGVHTQFIQVDDQASGQALIQVNDQGQNSIVLYAGGNHRITRAEIDSTLSHFNAGDYLVLQHEINDMAYIMAKAKAKGLRIWFNPAPFSADIFKLPLDAVEMLLVNEIEGAQLARLPLDTSFSTIVDTLVAQFPSQEIILTAGKHGAYYGFKSIREKGDIINFPVVDTTGAGDTFIGYLLASRVRGFDIKESLRLACKASSLKVSRAGAMVAMPLKEEVFG